MAANIHPTSFAIFAQYWSAASQDQTDPERIAERIIALADDDPGRAFNSGDLSREDYDVLWHIVHGRAVELAKPVIGWLFVTADIDFCQDMDAEDTRDTILSQGWQCWRTKEAACKAAEEWLRELLEEFADEGETMPEPDWRENGVEGGLIWGVGDGSRIFEVHPLRLQD